MREVCSLSSYEAASSRLGQIIRGTPGDGKLPVFVVHKYKAASTNSQLLCQPRLDNNLEAISINLTNPASKWSKLVATGFDWNKKHELAINALKRAFK
jgi:hypothetical protein